jgi:hypothetical protein
MTDIKDLDKDQLAELVMKEFNVELDLRKNLGQLRAEVVKLQSKAKVAVADEPAAAAPFKPTHILNRNNGMWFPWTEILYKHLTNAIPCDENGKPV